MQLRNRCLLWCLSKWWVTRTVRATLLWWTTLNSAAKKRVHPLRAHQFWALLCFQTRPVPKGCMPQCHLHHHHHHHHSRGSNGAVALLAGTRRAADAAVAKAVDFSVDASPVTSKETE